MANLALRRNVVVRCSLLGVALLGVFSVAWLRDPEGLQLLYARARAPVVTRTVNAAGLQIPGVFDGVNPVPADVRRGLRKAPPVSRCRQKRGWVNRLLAVVQPSVQAYDDDCCAPWSEFGFCSLGWELLETNCYCGYCAGTGQSPEPRWGSSKGFIMEHGTDACSGSAPCDCNVHACEE